TAGDGVKKQLRRRRAQLRAMERRRVRKSACDNDAITVTVKTVARRTENTETLAPARDRRCCDCGRVDCGVIAGEFIYSDCSVRGNQCRRTCRPRRDRWCQSVVAGLSILVLIAAGQHKQQKC